ncbi:MAG: hypothetical protein C0395_07120 [Gemmatimonas sp.]|nr:hypothetical protein [Gemmatimonas sp.]
MFRAATGIITALTLLALISAAPAARAEVLEYDLAEQWSDLENPFFPWTLWKSPSELFGINQPDFYQDGSGRRAWADQPCYLQMHVPVWSCDVSGPEPVVWMHGAEYDRTGTNVTSADWISYFEGTATIDGAIWETWTGQRSMRWSLVHNGSVLTSGDITTNGTYTAATPFAFAAGSGGPGALVLAVVPGDQIELRMTSLSEGGNMGESLWLRFHITLDTGTTAAATPPAAVRLLPCRPNPFNPRTTLRCELPAGSPGVLRIHDTLGRLVRAFTIPAGAAAPREIVWDGLDDRGRACPSGTYFARLASSGELAMTRMTLAR